MLDGVYMHGGYTCVVMIVRICVRPSYYPKASPFELPAGVFNEWAYIADRRSNSLKKSTGWWLMVLVLVLGVVCWAVPNAVLMRALMRALAWAKRHADKLCKDRNTHGSMTV